mgnify:CR=1 FL=1
MISDIGLSLIALDAAEVAKAGGRKTDATVFRDCSLRIEHLKRESDSLREMLSNFVGLAEIRGAHLGDYVAAITEARALIKNGVSSTLPEETAIATRTLDRYTLEQAAEIAEWAENTYDAAKSIRRLAND